MKNLKVYLNTLRAECIHEENFKLILIYYNIKPMDSFRFILTF